MKIGTIRIDLKFRAIRGRAGTHLPVDLIIGPNKHS